MNDMKKTKEGVNLKKKKFLRAISGENVYSQDIIDTTWGPIFTACYPVSANHDGTGEIIGAFCIEMDMQSAYGMVEKTNHISIICGIVAGAVSSDNPESL